MGDKGKEGNDRRMERIKKEERNRGSEARNVGIWFISDLSLIIIKYMKDEKKEDDEEECRTPNGH